MSKGTWKNERRDFEPSRRDCGCEARLNIPIAPAAGSYIVLCRLHEAAPELLVACKRIVQEDQLGEITHSAIQVCFAAIAKAEGGR